MTARDEKSSYYNRHRGSKKGERRGGRQKGTPNKSTSDAREAVAMFVEGNVDRLEGWLDKIAEKNPAAAFDRFMSVVEYHIPKLARSEINQAVDGELRLTGITLKLRSPETPDGD